MRQPDTNRDEQLFLRLRRIESAIVAAASGADRRVLLALQGDLRSLLATLKQRTGEMAANINRAGAQSRAAKAYARCASLGGRVSSQRKTIKAEE